MVGDVTAPVLHVVDVKFKLEKSRMHTEYAPSCTRVTETGRVEPSLIQVTSIVVKVN